MVKRFCRKMYGQSESAYSLYVDDVCIFSLGCAPVDNASLIGHIIVEVLEITKDV